MTIILFFGSFNPIHIGHLIIANQVAELEDIDRLWFVISPKSPFKKKETLLSEFDRLQMVRLAIADNPKLNLTDIEFKMSRPAYTIDTLKRLNQKYPQYHFKILMGSDNLKTFHKWKDYMVILENYGLIIYPRINYVIESSYKNHSNLKVLGTPIMNISASFIRKRIKNRQSIKYLVPLDLENYIKLKQLYT